MLGLLLLLCELCPHTTKQVQFMQKIVLLLLCMSSLWATAQDTTLFITAAKKCPLVVIVHQDTDGQPVLDSIRHIFENGRREYHYLLFEGKKLSATYIDGMMNEVLNHDTDHNIDKQKIYLLLLKADLGIKAHLAEKAIFAEMVVSQSEAAQTAPPLGLTLDKLSHKSLWEVEVADIERRTQKITYKDRRLGIGLAMGQNTQNQFTADTAFFPSSITKLGIVAQYRLTNRIQLLGKVMSSFKLPNKSEMSNQIFSQIDMDAGGEQTVTAEIKFHVFVQPSLQANYVFRPKERLQPYAGLGVSLMVFTSTYSKIEQTIDVSNIFSGGGPPSDIDGADPSANLPRLSGLLPTSFLTAGVQYKASKHLSLTGNIDYQFLSGGQGRVQGEVFQGKFSPVSLGASALLTFGKSKKYYRYMDARSKRVTKA